MTDVNDHSMTRKSVGVTATAAVLGSLIVGPVTGIVCAGAALYAVTRDDQVGDIARSTGSIACSAFDKSKELAVKYGVYDKMKKAATITLDKARELDAKYELSNKATSAISQGLAVAASAVHSNRQTEQGTAPSTNLTQR